MQMWKFRLAGIAGGLLTGGPLVLALTACDVPTGQASAETKTHQVTGDLAVMRDAEHGVTCWSRYGYTGTTLSCLPDWMLTPAQRKPVAIWPTGRPCDGHETCIALDKRRRAFDDADPEGLLGLGSRAPQ